MTPGCKTTGRERGTKGKAVSKKKVGTFPWGVEGNGH